VLGWLARQPVESGRRIEAGRRAVAGRGTVARRAGLGRAGLSLPRLIGARPGLTWLSLPGLGVSGLGLPGLSEISLSLPGLLSLPSLSVVGLSWGRPGGVGLGPGLGAVGLGPGLGRGGLGWAAEGSAGDRD
jgi:hypothetical protein